VELRQLTFDDHDGQDLFGNSAIFCDLFEYLVDYVGTQKLDGVVAELAFVVSELFLGDRDDI